MTTKNLQEIQTFSGGVPRSNKIGLDIGPFHKYVPKKYGAFYVVEMTDQLEPTFVFFKNPTLEKGRIASVMSIHPEYDYENDVGKSTKMVMDFFKRYPNNKAIGVIRIVGYGQPNRRKYRFPVMNWVNIDKSMQGTGLSKLMYSYVIGKYGGLWSDNTQSPGSRNAWAKLAEDDFYVLAYNSEDDTFHNVGIRKQPEDKEGRRNEVVVMSDEHDFPIYFKFKNGVINFHSKEDRDKFKQKMDALSYKSSLEQAQVVSGNRLFACKKIPPNVQARIVS